jgi:PAS domain S-box-containing protein
MTDRRGPGLQPPEPGAGGVADADPGAPHRAAAEEEGAGVGARLALLDAAVREAGEAVLITTADLDPPGPRIVFVNPAACRLTGYAAEELLGRTPRLLQGPNTDRAMLDRLRGQLARGERFAGQAVNYRRDGSEYVIDWHIAPVRAGDAGESSDPSAPVTHFVAVQRDVTARVRAEAERERLLAAAERARGAADEARSAAEAANAAKSQFLTMMSHELRTPLQAIGGYTEILELGVHGPLTAAQRRDLARVRESQEHLLGLIGEVLSYARLGRGMVTYRVTDVPVAEAVGAAEALVLPQLRAKGLGYTWAACDPGLRVRADRDKLQQILVNLLANAVKFTDGAGAGPGERAGQAARVEVSCGGCAPAGAAQDDFRGLAPGRVRIHVRDTGVGIPPDKLEAIFEPFVQVGRALNRPGEGTGLGLAISRDLARGMGGDLTAESTPGAGSTFTLELPAAVTDGT